MSRRALTYPLAVITAVGLIAGPAQAVDDTSGSADPIGAASGWIERSPEESPSARGYAAMAYDSHRDQTVLFGGNASAGIPPSTWVWDGDVWTELDLAPLPRARKMAAMTYDEARREVVLFGGTLHDDETILNDTWVFDGEEWTQRHPATSPPPKEAAEMVYDAARQEVVLFGGLGHSQETWVWDGTTWEQRVTDAAPPIRSGHAMGYDRSRQAVIVFGGHVAGVPTDDDTWSWDGEEWTKLRVGRTPEPLFGMASASFGKRIAIFGGTLGEGHKSDETWVLRNRRWHRLQVDTRPGPRVASSMVYDTARDEAVLFGGVDDDVTTEFDGETWVLPR